MKRNTKARDLKNKLIDGVYDRRSFNKALAGVGLAAVTMPLVPNAAKAAGKVNYFTWGGYDDPTFFQNYEAQHGELPEFSFFASEDEGLAKIRAGFTPTFGHPCSDTFPRWVRAGITMGMDKSRLEHWDDLWPEVSNLDQQYDSNGDVLFAPFDWGNSSVAFRTDLAPEYVDNHSWEILFDPKYSGRLATYNSAAGQAAVAGMVLGHPRESLFKPTDAQIAAIREKISEQRPHLRYYWDDQTTAEQGLASGELVAAYSWNEAPVRLRDQGLPVEYMTPKEGILFWVCGLTAINDEHGGGDRDAMYDAVNEMMSPEVGKYIFEEWGYGHGNKRAFELADPERLAAVNLSEPGKMMQAGVFFQDVPDDINAKLTEMFDEVKAGL